MAGTEGGDRLHRLTAGLGAYAKAKAGAVRDQASSLVDDQKSAAADGLDDVSEALRQASGHLSDHSRAVIAGLVQSAADRVESAAAAVRERELGQLIEGTRQLALRQPGLFFIGAVALGFLFARAVRSTGDHPDQPADQPPAAGVGGVLPAAERAALFRQPE
jgi:hypothetical protein